MRYPISLNSNHSNESISERSHYRSTMDNNGPPWSQKEKDASVKSPSTHPSTMHLDLTGLPVAVLAMADVFLHRGCCSTD